MTEVVEESLTSFPTKMKLTLGADEYKAAVTATASDVMAEENAVADDILSALEFVTKRQAWSIHTPGIKLNAEAQRVLTLPVRAQGERTTWEAFFETRNLAAKVMLPVAAAAAQRTVAQSESDSSTGSSANKTKKAIDFTEVGSSLLDLDRGLLVHVWRYPEAAVNFAHGWLRVWHALFEFHVEGIHAPMSMVFALGGSSVSVTALPPVLLGKSSESEAEESSMNNDANTGKGMARGPIPCPSEDVLSPSKSVLGYMSQQLIEVLSLSTSSTTALPLYPSQDGRHYLLSLKDVNAFRLQQFPCHTLRRELFWKMFAYGAPAAKDTGAVLDADTFIKEKMIPAVVRDLMKRMARVQERHSNVKTTDLAAVCLLKGNALRLSMKDNGVNMCMLFHVHEHALSLSQAQDRQQQEAEQENDVENNPTTGTASDSASDAAEENPNAERSLSPASMEGSPTTILGGGGAGGVAASFPPNVSIGDYCQQIVMACRTEMVARVLKAFCRFDLIRTLKEEGNYSEALDIFNRIGKLTATTAVAGNDNFGNDFWVGHILPALRKKFQTADSFTFSPDDIPLVIALDLMAPKLGAELDKEGKRFTKMGSNTKKGPILPKTEHLCLSCPLYLTSAAGQEASYRIVIQKCWDLLAGDDVKELSPLHQLAILRASCVSLHVNSADEELVERVLALVKGNNDDNDEDQVYQLRFALIAAELPIEIDRQAELIGDAYRRLKNRWPSSSEPGAPHHSDYGNMAVSLANCGRTIERVFADAHNAAVPVEKVQKAFSRKTSDISSQQLKVDSLFVSANLQGADVAYCLLSPTIIAELLAALSTSSTEREREDIASGIGQLITKLAMVNEEKDYAAELAMDVLTAFMAEPTYYSSCVGVLSRIASVGAQANMDVFGRDCVDTNGLIYRLGLLVATPHNNAKLERTLGELIEKAEKASHRGEAQQAQQEDRILKQQASLLAVARSRRSVAALRDASSLTENERMKTLLSDHATYLGGGDAEASKEAAVALLQRKYRQRSAMQLLQRKVARVERKRTERLALQQELAARTIQRAYQGRLKRETAKEKVQLRRKQVSTALLLQRFMRAVPAKRNVRFLMLLRQRKEAVSALHRIYRSRRDSITLHLDVQRKLTVIADNTEVPEREIGLWLLPQDYASSEAAKQISRDLQCNPTQKVEFEEATDRRYLTTLTERTFATLMTQHERYRTWAVSVGLFKARKPRSVFKSSLKLTNEEGEVDAETQVLISQTAAIRIQCAWKCNRARFELRFRKLRSDFYRRVGYQALCVTKIQALFRRYRCRLQHPEIPLPREAQ